MARLNPQLCAVVVFWGFNYVALKALYSEMAPAAVGLVRALAMEAVLLLWCWVRKEPLRYEKGDLWRLLGVGCLSMGIYMVFFLEGVQRTTAADGAIVMGAAPVMTYLLACGLKQERFVPNALVGSCVAFLGVVAVILGGATGEHGSALGNGLVFIASFLWAWSAVASRTVLHGYSPVRMFALSLPGALPVLLVYGFKPTLVHDFGAMSLGAWTMLASVIFGSGLLGFALFYSGLTQIGSARAALYQYFVPVAALIFAWMFFGTPPALVQLVGLATVLGGVALANAARLEATQVKSSA